LSITQLTFWFFLLLLLEWLYIRLAKRLGIVDLPNSRTMHTGKVVRGGGVIFPIAFLIYFLVYQTDQYLLAFAILILAITSFVDDLNNLPRTIRIVIQLGALLLVFAELDILMYWHIAFIVLALILASGAINAFNFMDGINGITCGYGISILGSFYYYNEVIDFFIDPKLLLLLILATLAFGIFNFRKKAICFAGDVGSITLALLLIFISLAAIDDSGNPVFILFFLLYGVDTIATIIQRLLLKENIFTPHKRHLFQAAVYKGGLSHIQVSAIFMIGQLLVNALIISLLNQKIYFQLIGSVSLVLVITLVYLIVKFKVLEQPLLLTTKA